MQAHGKGDGVMPNIRYNNYNNTYESFSQSSSESRTHEKVADVNRSVNDMRSEMLKLQIMVKAMYKVMIEQGVDPALIDSKIDEIVADPKTFEPSPKDSMPCPRCGRQVLDNGNIPLVGTCLYCGTTVKFTPRFDFGDQEENPEENDQTNI